MITVKKYAAPLGAEIGGVDCSKDVDPRMLEAIEQAWHDNLVIVFRGQQLDDDLLLAFANRFGELDDAPPNPSGRPWLAAYPKLNVVTNMRDEKGNLLGSHGNAEMSWHSDLSYHPVPAAASLLYGIVCPPAGGATHFANMYLAYEKLPEDIRQAIDGRRAIHDISTNAVGTLRAGYQKVSDPRNAPGCHHPLVRLHPKTGRKALFLPRRLNAYILGLSLEESEALLDKLWAHAVRSEFTWGHNWRAGDLVMWDNRCALHRRDSFDDSQPRRLHRAQTRGTEAPIAA